MMNREPRIFVSGHRNPDIDSIASAYALAELRRRQGVKQITAVCPGMLPERAAWLFKRFGVKPPDSRNDIHVRLSDMADDRVPVIEADTTLLDAVTVLKDSAMPRLPVVEKDKTFLGMLSPLTLLSKLLNVGCDSENSLTGRRVHSSIRLIRQVLNAETLTCFEDETIQDFCVYVAAMSQDNFEKHLPQTHHELAVIAGDRPEIHIRALARPIRLLIVTGNCPVEKLIVDEAEKRRVTILRTPYDSASVIRRIKFSMPVRFADFAEDSFLLSTHDLLRDVRSDVLSAPEDVYPVIGDDAKLAGVVTKRQFNAPPPFRMILVDHNETAQGIPGLEEIPVIEVVDHHRIGMMPTAQPIKFTGDIVGSTCTLVAMMYRASGESLTPECAGILLGGVVSDTLNLRSPTTAPLDHRMCEWLEKISGVKGADLMAELMKLDSPLISKSAEEVINGDRKNYEDNHFRFAVAQVEENNLELLHQRLPELERAVSEAVRQDSLDFFALLVTDPVRGNSELLMEGLPAVLKRMPYSRTPDGIFLLPGVLSRKKQLLPQLLSITSGSQG